ncbi:hypothetical protein H4S06_001276 [Coemansia sp. BCRC 34490]|nr:hypothetical protein H4S06_001276 [Coemansia sp. BCRC 34490]
MEQRISFGEFRGLEECSMRKIWRRMGCARRVKNNPGMSKRLKNGDSDSHQVLAW